MSRANYTQFVFHVRCQKIGSGYFIFFMVVKWSLACCFDVDKKTQVFLVLFDVHETVFAVFVFVFEQIMFRFHFGC